MDAMRCVMSRRYNKREQRSVSNGDWFHHEKNRGMRQKPLYSSSSRHGEEEACAKHISKACSISDFFSGRLLLTDSSTYCHLHLNQWAIVELPSLSNQDKILPIIHQQNSLFGLPRLLLLTHIRCRRRWEHHLKFSLKTFWLKISLFFEQTPVAHSVWK